MCLLLCSLFLVNLLLKSENQLQQYFHLLVEDSLKARYEVSASLQMVGGDSADVDVVLLLVPGEHGLEGIFLLQLLQQLLCVLVDFVHAYSISVLAEDAAEFWRISEEIVLHNILDKLI